MNFPELDLVILKTLVTNKKHALDFANECDTKLFSSELWNAANLIVGYIKTYKELPTLRVVTEKLSKGNNSNLIEHFKDVWGQVDKLNYNDREYKHDLEKIKRRFAEKQITSVKETFSKLDPGTMDVTKAVNDMQKAVQSIKSLSQVKSYQRKTLKEAIPEFREKYNARMNDPTFDSGIMTGYSYLDSVTDGLRPGELLLIGGESSSGKSMLLMNMAIQIWLQNNNVSMESDWKPGNHILYFSLEMPFEPCLNRVLARLSGCPSKLIRKSKLSSDDALKLKRSLRFINKYPYEFEIVDIPRGATMDSMEMIYEDCKAVFDPKIVVIDYLGLMDYEGGQKDMEDWLKLGKIAERTHEFSRVHNCTVLTAVQLNRVKASRDTDEKIGMHRIGRSALIMQNANIGIQIETRVNEKQYPDLLYHIIKNRDGELGKGRIIKNLTCGTLLDDKVEEDDTVFEMRDPDDISEKAELLDI
jgi:replicative DNA helicase